MTLKVYHIRNGIANIISYLHQNIEGRCSMGKKTGNRGNIANAVRVEKGWDSRGGGVPGSYPYVVGDTAEGGGIELYGMLEGNEQFDDPWEVSGTAV